MRARNGHDYDATRILFAAKAPANQAIRIEYGRYLDTLPPMRSLEARIVHFLKWLRECKNIDYRKSFSQIAR